MRNLLLAVQSALRMQLDPSVYRIGSTPESGDIFIADNEQYLPDACRFPAVGIKDGGMVVSRDAACPAGSRVEFREDTATLICWAPSIGTAIGAGIIGDVTQPGVLDIFRHIHAVLFSNLLLDDVVDVRLGSIPASITTDQDGRISQSLTVPYIYSREIQYG